MSTKASCCLLLTLSSLFIQRASSIVTRTSPPTTRRLTTENPFNVYRKMLEGQAPTYAQNLFKDWYAELKKRRPPPPTRKPEPEEQRKARKKREEELRNKEFAREINDNWLHQYTGGMFTTQPGNRGW
uniref:Uncharacterized protein n=1 Tax=Cacopsylla melanoneura TaxID=428564 RepID=A0A8D8TN17_9HEMI